MTFLHTSDWHLGRRLYGRRRREEFAAFLDWLIGLIEERGVNVLLIAGDVFDTTTPGNGAQELYYRFLYRASVLCSHLVITAGNHDSPGFLDAPGPLLKAMNIHVVGIPGGKGDLLTLDDKVLIGAVPYLRDRDIRRTEPGESPEKKEESLRRAQADYYGLIMEEARRERALLEADGARVPLIMMGHLFTAGGVTAEGDGVRELYVGSLAHTDASLFPEDIDYLALGHLHVPQRVGNSDFRRYSGSPLPMGFGEAGQQKEVVLFEYRDGERRAEALPIPSFRLLESLSGDLGELTAGIELLKMKGEPVWVEAEYTGGAGAGDLRTLLEEASADSPVEILRIRNRSAVERIMKGSDPEESLDDLDDSSLFERCLDTYGVDGEERKELRLSYARVVRSLEEEENR